MAQYHSYLDDSVGTGASTINDMRSADSAAYGIGVSSDFYVSGVSTFVGMSTFFRNVAIGSSLSVTGVSTFVGLSTFNDGVLVYSGVSTFSDIKVSGVSTLSGNVYVGAKLYDGDGDFGTAGQILSSDGTDLEWIAPSTTSVANASNVGTNLDATDATQYVVFLGATSGNNPCRVDSQLTYNPSDDELGVSNLTASGVSGFAVYTESVTALGTITGSNNLDVSAGSVFTCTIAGTNAVTFTVTNSVASKMCSGIVIVTWTGTGTRSITMTNGKWQGGSPPTWSATATTDIFSFFTPDNGTNVYVSTLGVGYA